MELYLDTSVIGALFDSENPIRIEITKRLLHSILSGLHIGFISNIVNEEIDKAPFELRVKLLKIIKRFSLDLITEDDESANLVDKYVNARIMRKGALLDLRHLALATVHGVDALVSWNYHDIVNIRTRREVHSINLRLGYPLIEIVSPEEVV
jgi:predicted nucleic acid-binding protein